MTTLTTDPIGQDWSSPPSEAPTPQEPTTQETTANEGPSTPSVATKATAQMVADKLATIEVADIDQALVPYLAAAATELALATATSLNFGSDDAPVALLRMIARASISDPQASGPHTAAVLAQLS